MAKSILHYLNEQKIIIDPENFVLPTTKDFRSTDELTRNIEKASAETKNNIKECLYYIEKPYSEVPGYYSEDEVIIVRGKPDLLNSHLGYFDADTLYFPINKIRDNNAVVIHNGGQFFIKDYLQYASANFGNHSSIGVRFIGINAPESNKYTTVYADEINEEKVLSLKDLFVFNEKTNSYVAVKDEYRGRVYYDTENEDWKKQTAEFYQTNIDGVECYCQIINTTKSEIIFSDISQSFETQETDVKAYITKMADSTDNKISHEITQKLIELIGNKEVVMMLDHNMLNAQINEYPTTYSNYGNSLADVIAKTIEQFQERNRGPYYSGFVGYGQDGYGRFLGCLYVKTKVPDLDEKTNDILGEQWINVTKYLLYHFGADGKTAPNTLELSFNENSPVHSERHNFASAAFNVYSYDRKPYVIMEDLDNMSYDSINKQRNLQKSILGFDFDSQLKDWTVMIGDCVFLVPPTSIRCVTRNGAESVPLIRSRGSAMKELGQSERIIEMTLFFNDEHGINGIEVETPVVIHPGNTVTSSVRYDENTLQPTGETVKYYMNGLRALISMFKLCPFMPINNTYINDVLCVDAVALSSLSISTVPGYPKCISASIQLLEFNYHAYMSELPFDGSEDAETIQSTNIFEKCIDYESLRYYYQKPLYRGEVASRYSFDSREYLNATYGSRTALQPMSFGDSSIEFYVPNSTHLDRLYQAKLEAISNPIKTQYKVTDDAKAWAEEIGKLYPIINNYISSPEYTELIDFLKYGPFDPENESKRLFPELNTNNHLGIYYIIENIDQANLSLVHASSYDNYIDMLMYAIKQKHLEYPDTTKSIFTFSPNNNFLKKCYNGHLKEVCWSSEDGLLLNDNSYLYDSAHTYSGISIQFDIGDIILNNSDLNVKLFSNTDIVSLSTTESNHKHIGGISIISQSYITANKTNIINLLKNISIDINDDDSSANNYSNYFDENGGLLLTLNFDPNNEGEFLGLNECPGYKIIQRCYEYYTMRSNADGTTQFELPSDYMQTDVNSNKQSTDIDTNSTFEFVKFPNDDLMKDVIVTNISASLNNNLSKIYLKAMDGYAPQYLGGQDTIVEVTMTTASNGAVAAINLLPKLCSEYMRNYRLILSCVPLRINTQFTRMLGVNEVLIDSLDVSTVDKQPGLYEITMRLIATDRTVRNKEALKKLDVNNAGAKTNSATNSYTVRDYFDIKNKIGAAEVYPDLELPTIKELELYEFKFIRYSIYDTSRVYPDPDFYFVYGAATANKIIRDSLLESLEKDVNSGYSGKVNNTFTFSDYLGGQIQASIFDNNENRVGYDIVGNIATKSNSTTTDNENKNISKALDCVEKYVTAKYTNSVLNDSIPFDDNHPIKVGDVYTLNNIISNLGAYNAWNISSNASALLRDKNSILNNKITNKQNDSLGNTISTLLNKKSEIDEFEILVKSIANTCLFLSASNKFHVDGTAKTKEINKNSPLSDAYNIYSSPILDNNKTLSNLNKCSDIISIFDSDLIESSDWMIAKIQESYGLSERFSGSERIPEQDYIFPDYMYRVVAAIGDAISSMTTYNDTNRNSDSWIMTPFRGTDNTPVPIHFPFSAGNSLLHIVNNSIAFGVYNITQYSASYIKQHFSEAYAQLNKYLDEDQQIDLNQLDPNKSYFLSPTILRYQIISNESCDKIIEQYKLNLLYDIPFATNEMFINLYVLMLSLCIDKQIMLSEMELIAYSFDLDNMSTSNRGTYLWESENLENFKNELNNIISSSNDQTAIKDIINQYSNLKFDYDTKTQNDGTEIIVQINDISLLNQNDDNKYHEDLSAEILYDINKSLTNDKNILMLGNYILAAALHVSGGFDSAFYQLLENRDYAALNDLLKDAQLSNMRSGNEYLYKFILALCGRKAITAISDLGTDTFTGSELSTGIIDNTLSISQANDPFTYTRDSFYDMMTTDMRGRMCRAFPTFYMLFVDEGREIGLWKLNDNFYNMSSISEISITKSRKIAADTCNIQMTNMFKTFTTDDEDGKEMAYDLETLSSMRSGIQDVWDSIFSPRKLFLRDYQERMEQNPIDRAQLKPGVRIHVRMGYGSDAYALPTVFNGVVAQVSTGELVNIVCQGDGVELTNVFTDSMTSEDINNMDALPGIKQIANWINTGATPKTILTGFLTTKGTWLHKAVNNLTNGRFFDDNTFGINHFGDPDYKDIFGLSECSQNIYEAASTATFNTDATYCTGLQSLYSTTSVPHVSTAIMGKSYWDLMHTMAGVSLDYISSVAPFGLRSTIFYGLPHYYYAYDYIKTEDGRVKEKRKPFQQYHLYSSFGDIIENNISTSSEFMKTNAVGLYSSEGFFGANKTHRVGPVFVDIDIYPEYQKSMTVDTSLIAQGNLATFLIPYWNEIVENTSMYSRWGIDNENIAWRITARALKDSVKEMYQGELITIGDPSVKPYDIIYLSDVYENMQGGCEVEAVTHTLSCQTGFTSSIYVDPLIDIDNQYYQMAHSLCRWGIGVAAFQHAAIVGLSFAISRNVTPLTKIATHVISKNGLEATNQAAKILDFFNVGDVDSPIITKLKNSLTSIDFVTNSDASAVLKSISKKVDNLANIKINSLSDLTKYIDDLNDIDVSSLQTMLGNIPEDKLDKTAQEVADNLTKNLDKIAKQQKDIVEGQIKDIAKDITSKVNADDLDDVLKARLNVLNHVDDIDLSSSKSIRKYLDAIDDLSKVDNLGDDVFKAIGSTAQKTIATNTDELVEIAGKAAISEIDNLDDVLAAATTATRVSNPIIFIASMALEFAVELIIAGTANNAIKRWMRNLETLRIYPLTKNKKVYTAGLNGSLGIVVGSSTADMQGWLQESISNFFDSNSIWKHVLGFIVGDTTDMETIAAKYRRENGLPETDSDIEWANKRILGIVSSVYENMYQYNGLIASRLTQKRIETLYGNSDEKATAEATAVYNALRITSEDLTKFSPQVNGLVLLTDIEKATLLPNIDPFDKRGFGRESEQSNEPFINVMHNKNSSGTQQISYGSNSTINISYIKDENTGSNDYPLVCLELYDIFKAINNYILNEHSKNEKRTANDIKTRVYVLSALIPDDNTWHSTGYSCDFIVNDESDDYICNMLDTLNDKQFNNIFEYHILTDEDGKYVEQEINDKTCHVFNITVRPLANAADNWIVAEWGNI